MSATNIIVQVDPTTVRVEGQVSQTVRVIGPAVAPRIVVQGDGERIILKESPTTVRVQGQESQVIRVVGPPPSTATAVGGSVPEKRDKDRSPATTSGDGSPTGLTMSVGPTGANPYVSVFVNGVGYAVGDGVKTLACYFSSDGGTTARIFGAIIAGDQLIWNGAIAGFDLLSSSDCVSLDYDT